MNNNINVLIKKVMKEFEVQGMKTFLTKYDMKEKKVVGSSIFIGKANDMTYMSNASVLMGYLKQENDSAVKFVFNKNKPFPWTKEYNIELKAYLKLRKEKDLTGKLLERFELLNEAAQNFEPLIRRALANNYVKLEHLNKNTRNMLNLSPISPTTKDPVPEINTTNNYTPVPEVNIIENPIININKNIELETIVSSSVPVKSNVMVIAHQIRRQLIADGWIGNYHAIMKLALKKAHTLKETEIVEIKTEQIEIDPEDNYYSEMASVALDQEELVNQYQELIDGLNNSSKEETREEVSLQVNKTLTEVIQENKDKYEVVICFVENTMWINAFGTNKGIPSTFTGAELEKHFLPQVNTILKGRKSLVIHHHGDIFNKLDDVQFIQIP